MSKPSFSIQLAKGEKKATQLKSVHAWVILFHSSFIGTINFIAKILDSGTNGKWEYAEVASYRPFCGSAMDGFVQYQV